MRYFVAFWASTFVGEPDKEAETNEPTPVEFTFDYNSYACSLVGWTERGVTLGRLIHYAVPPTI